MVIMGRISYADEAKKMLWAGLADGNTLEEIQHAINQEFGENIQISTLLVWAYDAGKIKFKK